MASDSRRQKSWRRVGDVGEDWEGGYESSDTDGPKNGISLFCQTSQKYVLLSLVLLTEILLHWG